VLEALVKDIKSAAASIVDQYLARASVAIPFIVAFGFATAALAVELMARFGAKNAFWMMAGGFFIIGVIAALFITIREREAAAAGQHHIEGSGLAELGEMVTSGVATRAAGRLPLGLLAPLIASPSASAARLLGRNIPLVLLLAFIVLLFWPTKEDPPREEEEPSADAALPDRPTGEQEAWREAA
jgi:uncharacterized membrane protein